MAVEKYYSTESNLEYYASPSDSFSPDEGNGDYYYHNGYLIAQIFQSYGWSDNAIAGLLGNMLSESWMNPGAMEGYVEWTDRGGFGLTQWTPATKYRTWADENGYLPYYDIEYQCMRIHYEMTDSSAGQYYASFWKNAGGDWITGNDFIVSTRSPFELACAFVYNYERPAASTGSAAQQSALQQARGNNANLWYSYITGESAPDFDPPVPIVPTKRKGMSKLLLYAAGSDII